MVLEFDELSRLIINWRRKLHTIPEVGLYLPETKKYICEELNKMGIEYELHDKTSGIIALVQGKLDGKTFAIRCDMDALPIKEETNLSFTSRNNGYMHACGHDVHCAIGLGIAKLLNENIDKITGCVKIIFQPGEEGYNGADYMIKEGALENPNVNVLTVLHVITKFRGLPVGAIGLKSGAILAGNRVFEIISKGRGGHIANISSIFNPLTAISKVAIGIDEIQKNAQLEKKDLALGITMSRAGEKTNIVPTIATLNGNMRYYSESYADELIEKIKQLCSNNNCELFWKRTSGVIDNDEIFTQQLSEISQHYDDIVTVTLEDNFMASDDAYHYFEKVKGSYIHLNCGFEEESKNLPLHTPKLMLNEDIFIKGAIFMARCAIDWLKENS